MFGDSCLHGVYGLGPLGMEDEVSVAGGCCVLEVQELTSSSTSQ